MASDAPELHLGLISGTSADGIDVALVRFEGAHCALVKGHTFPWDAALRARLVALGQGGHANSLDELGALDVQIAHAFSDAALTLLERAHVAPRDVRALGSMAQTVRLVALHHPFTWQLATATSSSERTGSTRSPLSARDVAAGGLRPRRPASTRRCCTTPAKIRSAQSRRHANFTLLHATDDVACSTPALRPR